MVGKEGSRLKVQSSRLRGGHDQRIDAPGWSGGAFGVLRGYGAAIDSRWQAPWLQGPGRATGVPGIVGGLCPGNSAARDRK